MSAVSPLAVPDGTLRGFGDHIGRQFPGAQHSKFSPTIYLFYLLKRAHGPDVTSRGCRETSKSGADFGVLSLQGNHREPVRSHSDGLANVNIGTLLILLTHICADLFDRRRSRAIRLCSPPLESGMPFEPNPEYMTVEQAAAYLDVTPGAIRRLLRQHGLGEFLRARISKQLLIRREDLDAMELSQGTLHTVSDASRAAAKPSRGRRTGAA